MQLSIAGLLLGFFVCFEKKLLKSYFKALEAVFGCTQLRDGWWLWFSVSLSVRRTWRAQRRCLSPEPNHAHTLKLHFLRRPDISLFSHKPTTLSPLCPSEAQGEGRSSSKATCNRCRRLPSCPSSHPLLKAPLLILSLQPGVQGEFHPIPLLPVPAPPHLRNCFCQRNPSGLCCVGLWSQKGSQGPVLTPGYGQATPMGLQSSLARRWVLPNVVFAMFSLCCFSAGFLHQSTHLQTAHGGKKKSRQWVEVCYFLK